MLEGLQRCFCTRCDLDPICPDLSRFRFLWSTAEYWVLSIEYWALSTEHSVLNTQNSILSTQCSVLTTVYWILNTEYSVELIQGRLQMEKCSFQENWCKVLCFDQVWVKTWNKENKNTSIFLQADWPELPYEIKFCKYVFKKNCIFSELIFFPKDDPEVSGSARGASPNY